MHSRISVQKSFRIWWIRERSAGPLAAVRKLGGVIWEFLRESLPEQTRRRYGDMDYDWAFRVDTTSATVGWRTRLLGLLHSPYQPIDAALFHEMMAALEVDFRECTFIDVGSGKGRALLLALEYPFRKILGVELLPALNQIAQENIRKLSRPGRRHEAVEAICGDATEFRFPLDPLVVLLFNPLPETDLRKLMRNLEGSLRENRRPLHVIYANPVFEDIVGNSPILTKVGGTHQFAIFRTASAGKAEN
jgi:SAM-dependent methyltransferase